MAAAAATRPEIDELVGDLPEAAFHEVPLPANCSRWGLKPAACLALVLDGVLSRAECDGLVARAEATPQGLRYVTEATQEVDGQIYTIALQNPRRYKLGVFVDGDFAEALWQRLQARCGARIREAFEERDGWRPARGLNERLRVLQYWAAHGDSFPPHFDLVVEEPEASPPRQSLLTVLVYLNDGGGAEFAGGETLFLDRDQRGSARVVGVEPRAGRVVLFEHELFHSGSLLLPQPDGCKLVMRTDVMYDTERAEGAAPARVAEEELATVAQLLERVGYSHLEADFDAMGLLGTIDAFRGPGKLPMACMLAEMGLADEAREAILREAFS